MNEQDLVLTVGVQVRGLDVPLLGLDLQLVKIEILQMSGHRVGRDSDLKSGIEAPPM
jgi:hypothetical protein